MIRSAPCKQKAGRRKAFTLAHLIDSYQNKPDITWSTLSSCYAEEGQLDFEVMYGDSGFCGSEFYLDTARSTDNDYYFEGAFAISSDYEEGSGTAKTVLAVDLPNFGRCRTGRVKTAM